MNKLTPSAKTWDEWKALGYHVVKGQKATSWTIDGKARFDREQVEFTEYNDEEGREADDFFGTVYEFDRIGDKD
jgi:hypothetical protein